MIPLNSNLSTLTRSQIRVYTNLARQTPDCAMLTIGEPDFDTPEVIKEAAITALRADMTHYAPNQGTLSLRQAVAEFETKRGNATSPEQVLVTIGACQALFTALLGVLNPGEEIIVPTPGFGLYETIATVAGAKTVELDISKEDFRITRQSLARIITPKTKAIVLNSPNNPTGVVLDQESVTAVKEAVLGKPIFVVCDNVYQALSDGTCPDLSLDPELADQMLLCQSFSKPYAMTGWRVGYLVGPADVVEKLLLLNAAELASIPTFLQDACVTALKADTSAMAEVYRRRRAFVCRRLEEIGLSFPKPEGAFYVFPDISGFGMSDEEFCTRMIREAAVAAVPGSCFGCPGRLRISYCCADDQLEEGLRRLEYFLKRL